MEARMSKSKANDMPNAMWRASLNRDVIEAAMLKLKAKDMPNAIDSLYPFLTSLPSIHHGPSFECIDDALAERYCDIFTLEAPSSGPLYESIDVEMMALRRECYSLLSGTLCLTTHPHKGIRHVALSVDNYEEDVGPNLGSGRCTFRFLVYWATPEAMACFKHPERESIQKHGKKYGKKNGMKIASDWWMEEVVGRFARLENAGAWLKQGTFNLRAHYSGDPVRWCPEPGIVAKRGRWGCGSCCTM